MSRITPVLVMLGGTLCAVWVVAGRALWDLLGSLTLMYALLIGLPIFVLHIVLTRAFAKMSARNLQPRRFTYIVLWCSWACLAVLGLTSPDRVNGELHTVLTGAQEPALGLAIGISNPLAIIGVGLSVAAVISILAELRGPRVHEDEILDAYENRSTQ